MVVNEAEENLKVEAGAILRVVQGAIARGKITSRLIHD